jgi:23S rRNA pseudouridine2605 synthase
VIDELGTKVDPSHDRITVDGRPLKAKRKLYIALHKPNGYICSRQDPERRKTLSVLLPKEWTNLQSVGRLDFNSEGLIFLTNDGDFSLRLTHPRYGVRKRYRVVVEGKVDRRWLTE